MSRPLPFKCDILDSEPVEIKNPYTMQGILLEPDAIAVYDCIKGAEMMAHAQQIEDGSHELWQTVRQGLDWFIKYEPKAYGVLLD
mgnify:FL=1|jgi:hypothetical protein